MSILNPRTQLDLPVVLPETHYGRKFAWIGFKFSTWVSVVVTLVGCTTLPEVPHSKYRFPKGLVFLGDVKRPYSKLGQVRVKVPYRTLDPVSEESELCRNYFNKAALDLYRMAKEKGADAVIDLKSVVFLADGRTEVYPSAECADDGIEGQVLAQGVAIKWKPPIVPRRHQTQQRRKRHTTQGLKSRFHSKSAVLKSKVLSN